MAGTLGRTLVTKTVSGSSIYYDVLNSQGTTSRFTVTTLNIGAQTNFGQAGVTEYSGGFAVIQSLALPDGTSYNFGYDYNTPPGGAYFYGSLVSITLPTGSININPPIGQIIYTYANFADSYGNKNRWVNTRTVAGGTWTYAPAVISTCASGGTGCQQKVTVTRPSSDDTVYTFTLNNGAWNTQTDSYTGSSSGGGTLLRTVTTDYDFSNSCPDPGCTGAAYIRPVRGNHVGPQRRRHHPHQEDRIQLRQPTERKRNGHQGMELLHRDARRHARSRDGLHVSHFRRLRQQEHQPGDGSNR